ncbi:MAG: MBL fold metallo-hydrolase [Desulfurococcales archaeon]|nr:MBL fold metallo-hydrolase [Desulfurococcales archaeon]
MIIKPLAFDSFGVRSQATLVKLEEHTALIDPGVALGPKRYGLPPTDEEFRALDLARKEIISKCKASDIVLVTHYHYDHHPFPDDDEMYEACFTGKTVIAKNIRENINNSGKRRGKLFESKVKEIADRLEWGDGREFDFNNTRIVISPAVWHGEVKSKVGTVVMVLIQDKENREKFLFGSDAQNLADPAALEWAVKADPNIAIIDGYPTIFLGWKMSQKSFEKSLGTLGDFIMNTGTKTIILDHHIVRDINYKEKIKPILDLAEEKQKKILTAAEYYQLENFFLEAWRKEIHQGKRTVNVDKYYELLHKTIDN